MAANIFLISDTHFGHANILNFKTSDGKPVRHFSSVEEMDETMVDNWNRVVRPFDHVYHLGDVVINKKHLPILERLNGKKRLVRGNHDIFPDELYRKYFEKIYGVRVFDGAEMILSHIPLHPHCVPRFKLNVHGHLHTNRVMIYPTDFDVDQVDIIDPMYFSVCVEQINYTPIALEEVRKLTKNV